MKTETTIDEQNDAIRNQVDAELPRPIGGFESSDHEDEHRAAQDTRFLELVGAMKSNVDKCNQK